MIMSEQKFDSLLIGISAIISYTNVSKPTFYGLLKQGFPANLIGGTWYAHKENINNFFKYITSKPPKQIPEEKDPQ